MIPAMNNLRLLVVLGPVFLLMSCGPLAAVGLVGSTITNAAYHQAERDQRDHPRNNDAIALTNLNLGVEYMRAGEYRLAMEKLQRARAAKPDYYPTYNALGLLYQNLGLPDDAEKNFLYALKLNPDNSSTLNNYGQFLCSQGKLEEAEKRFLAAAENPLYQTPEIPYANIGTCAYKNNDIEKANNYFQKALALNPVIPIALIHMCEISYNAGDYPAARQYLKRYLSSSKHTPQSLWLGIRIERELGDKDMESSYTMLLRNQYPESEEAKKLQGLAFN